MTQDRRRAPRVDAVGRVQGRIVSLDAEVRIREISLGGLSIESSMEFPVGAVHRFELCLGDGALVAVSAAARYSRQTGIGGAGNYITGFQFVEDESDQDVAVTQFVEGLA